MKKKGFTLSELLVVVVIIGVLSAVVLPKFSKVIETRKTTEAEELMSAVRTEQEARCTLSKKYADISTLGSYKEGKNFSYSNEENHVGIIATASNNKYRLEMPSYADGRICCSDVVEGSKECEKLNKNYPLCSDLTNKSRTPDYVAGNAGCGVEVEPSPEPDPPIITCPTEHPMVPAYTDGDGCTVTTSWELKDYPDCWVSTPTKSDCPTKENTCSRSYCYGNQYITHDDDWYAARTWTADKTECCDAAKPCPETCEGDKVRDTRVSYEGTSGWGACCKYSCETYCNSYGYGRPCYALNASKSTEDSSRVYHWAQSSTKYYDDDPSSCYYCPTLTGYPDLKDEEGNILVKGVDRASCSTASCPTGYIKKNNVCYAPRHAVKKTAVVGIRMTGYITVPGAQDAIYYDGGTQTVEGGGKITVTGYNKILRSYTTTMPKCGDDPSSLCNSCAGSECNSLICIAQEDYSKVPHWANDSCCKPTVKKTSQCGGLSFKSGTSSQCALGQVKTVSVYVCEQ